MSPPPNPPAPALRLWLVGLVAGAVIAGCAQPGADGTVTVTALWAEPSPAGGQSVGASSVAVSLTDTGDSKDFAVDLGPSLASGAGPTWQAAAWTAATVAMLYAGDDPRGRSVQYRVDRPVDEPSASALLATGALAGLTGADLGEDVSLVGTIMPNGSVGAIPRIPELLQAARADGIGTVLIPAGVSREPHGSRDDPVDLRKYGQSLGLTVQPVATITEAAAVMSGSPVPVSTAPTVAVDPPLLRMLTRQTRRVLVRVQRALAELPPPPGQGAARTLRRIRAEAAATLRSVPRLLLRGDVFVAFSQATLVESEMLQYRAEVAALASLRDRGPADTRTALLQRAREEKEVTLERIQTAAARGLRHLEQYPALADALTWGTGNLAIIDTAVEAVRRPRPGPDRLAAAAAELARARYRLETFLPVQLRAVSLIGRTEVVDDQGALSLLSGYAALLGQCADAVMAYYDELAERSRPLQRLVDRLAQQQRLWRNTAPAAGGQQPAVMQRLAWALSYYVASSFLFTVGPLLPSVPSRAQPLLLDPGYFADQVNIATEENNRSADRVAAAGLDPSYVEWGNEWGLALAEQGAGVEVPDEIRARGLSYQWYAAVQGSMVASLAAVGGLRP